MAQIADGTTKTMMVSENVHAWYWTFGANITGAASYNDNSAIKDTKRLFGFIWKNNPGPNDHINGDKYYDLTSPPATMEDFADETTANQAKWEMYAYPSSFHPGGVNVAFCAGDVRFINDSMDPQIYGQLMTSNSKRSKFFWNNVADRKLTQPSDGDY